MPSFTVIRGGTGEPLFLVKDPDGIAVQEITSFLTHLSTGSCSAYTLRSYAVGLAHFYTWLAVRHLAVDASTAVTIEAYIDDFRRGEKGGACRANPQRQGQINRLTRKVAPSVQRQPRTINHRLSVVASFFAYRIQRDTAQGTGPWNARTHPVPMTDPGPTHGMVGRDAPRRGRRGALRQRVPRQIPKQLDPLLIERLIETAVSWRDKSILTILYRTGQRIGDWHELAGQHGVLGMTLADVDAHAKTISVRLKGARDEHRVPITDDFWPLLQNYLVHERKAAPTVMALWVGVRKGAGKPLSYAAFESALRYIGQKIGANVNAHQFRHTVAQALVDHGSLKVAQAILGHRHIGTTADIYVHVDHQAMVDAVATVKGHFDRVAGKRPVADEAADHAERDGQAERYAFAYDQITLDELEQASSGLQSQNGGTHA